MAKEPRRLSLHGAAGQSRSIRSQFVSDIRLSRTPAGTMLMTNNSKRFRPSLNRVSRTKAPKSISPLPSTNVSVVAASVPFSATASGTMGLSALEALHRSALRPSGHPAARPSARLTTWMRRSEKQSMRPRSALHPCHALKPLRFYRGLGCDTPSRNEYHGPAWSLVDSKRLSPWPVACALRSVSVF